MVPPPPPPPPPGVAADYVPDRTQFDSRKDVERAIRETMTEAKVFEGEAKPAAKCAPGIAGTPTTVMTNFFKVNMKKQFTVYRYNVHMEALVREKPVVFTKKSGLDSISADRKSKSCDILKTAFESNKEFFGEPAGNLLYYDAQNILFTFKPLFKRDLPVKLKVLEIPGEECATKSLHDFKTITLQIFVGNDEKKGNDEKIDVSLDELCRKELHQFLDEKDTGLRQFVEIALKQFSVWNERSFVNLGNGGSLFLKYPLEHNFVPNDFRDVGDGKFLIPGLKKGVSILTGREGTPEVFSSLDFVKSPFHKEQLLTEKLGQTIRWDGRRELSQGDKRTFEAVIKGLVVYTTHIVNTKQKYIVAGISSETAKNKGIVVDGVSMTVQMYYQKKYDKTLTYPELPLVVMENKKSTVIPMELLFVDPLQRVTTGQMTSFQSKQTTRECAIMPQARLRGLDNIKNTTELCQNNHLQALGINIEKTALTVPARILAPPNIINQNSAVVPRGGRFRFMKEKTAIAATVGTWAAYGIAGDRFFERKNLNDIVMAFMKEAKSRGIGIGNPAEVAMISATDPENKIKVAADHNCSFILFITPESIQYIHNKMKLWEKQYGVITMDMKTNTAINVTERQKMLTMENIINKLNIKLGGLNYTIDQHFNGVLVLGISLSHPPPSANFDSTTAASVVGYSANTGATSDSYTGNFSYIPPRRNEVSMDIDHMIGDIITRYYESQKKFPIRVVIYRGGAADGDYPMILKQEIPLIINALKRECQKDVRLVYIVVTKDHNTRLFTTSEANIKKDKACDANIGTGVVVDKGAVHPLYKEFYLNSHMTLQGSAKTPRYTIIFDDTNATMDRVEKFTFDLCHGHQIVGLPTSLPSPLYIAEEYAKRGRYMLGDYLLDNPNVKSDDYENLNNCLSYTGSKFRNLRINA